MLLIKQKSPYLPAAALALASLAGALQITLQPQPGGAVAAVFPPWWAAPETFTAAAAAGPVIRFGAWPFIVILAPGTKPLALRQHGAWLLLNPQALGACGRASKRRAV